MHLVRVIQKARSALNLKRQLFVRQFFCLVSSIKWVIVFAVMSLERPANAIFMIASESVEKLGVECHSIAFFAFSQYFCNKLIY